jgi:cell fate (sporulation/competence/biofilm development) regulator YmcA (YheA/YmcA/DUF963 family)
LAEAPTTIFAVDFATLAREIAQDIFSVEQIVALHRLTDEEWAQIQAHPRFIQMLSGMQRDWQSAANTRERVKIKAQTGLESQLEVFIAEINNPLIPLSQRVDAGRFLARLGELDGAPNQNNQSIGSGVTINIVTSDRNEPLSITATSIPKVIEHAE